MLKSLIISNYALIDHLEIDFDEGFSVITGETGAGKSILLGALSMLLGKRADTNVLQDKNRKCIVEGTFDISKLNLQTLFQENDIDHYTLTHLRREIIPSGRSRAFVNDTPVKLTLLKEIGDQLVDIHSQHQTLMLGKAGFQLQALDDFIGNPELVKTYKETFLKYQGLKRNLQSLTEENEKAKKDEDYYRFLFEEIDQAKLSEDEFKHLLEREKFLAHAEEVLQGVGIANSVLTETEGPLVEKIEEVANALTRVAEYLPEINELLNRINSVSIELKDIAADVARLNSETDFDPNELTQITDRLDIVYRLQKKHNKQSVSELISLTAEYLEKLESITTNEEEIHNLTKQVNSWLVELKKYAGKLAATRKRHSNEFARSVKNVLKQLGMKDAGFEIKVDQLPDFTLNGSDRISFLFNANKGGELIEIAQVASGGELSRLMLAVKSLITKEQLLPTVVFDEIDAGVSGEVAAKVGNILKKMSQHHQLIVISHLPQIAAKADHHFKVFKEAGDEFTYTMISQLDDEGRVDEIAKLLSDEKISTAAMDTARELLGRLEA